MRLCHLENYLPLTAAFYSIDWIETHGWNWIWMISFLFSSEGSCYSRFSIHAYRRKRRETWKLNKKFNLCSKRTCTHRSSNIVNRILSYVTCTLETFKNIFCFTNSLWHYVFIRLIRHSRFGGTYVVQNMKATGENQMICHKPYQKIEALEFGHDKVNFANRLLIYNFSLFSYCFRKY